MAEDFTLTTPITDPAKVTNKYRIVILNLHMEAPQIQPGVASTVHIQLRDNVGNPLIHEYTGDQATDYIKWINTANFSTKSMQKRILEKLTAEGVLPPGTVTGTPDPPTTTD